MAKLCEAALYAKLSQDHLKQAAQSLSRFGHYIDCTPGEAVMDIGCGPGDVTYNVIFPSLHPSFSILVGIDVSREMIHCAKDRWIDDRLNFVIIDAAECDSQKIQETLPVTKFNKIFSFYALQWITDRRYLKSTQGGQAFLVLVVNSGVYSVWDTLARSYKWANFFKNVKLPLNEYHYMANPAEVLTRCLEDEGLEVTLCDVQFHKDAFSSNIESDMAKKAKLRSVDPLVSLLPENLKDDYINDALEYTKRLVGPRGAVDYTSLTVICKKPLHKSSN